VSCPRCQGNGRILVPLRGTLQGREALRRLPGGNMPEPDQGWLPCPDCGGPGRLTVSTVPIQQWAAGMAAAANWSDGGSREARDYDHDLARDWKLRALPAAPVHTGPYAQAWSRILARRDRQERQAERDREQYRRAVERDWQQD
jgi:hypothetical protein